MSHTELFFFNKTGEAWGYAAVNNSWRGAMAIWQHLEKKYLPSLPEPGWITHDSERHDYYSRTVRVFDTVTLMKEIWDLFWDDRLTEGEKIVLGTTFDGVLVKAEDFEKVIAAFEQFEANTSLKEQAEIIRKAIESGEYIAMGWNQMSICRDCWANRGVKSSAESGEDAGNTGPRAYNCLTQNDHWYLFDDLGKKPCVATETETETDDGIERQQSSDSAF